MCQKKIGTNIRQKINSPKLIENILTIDPIVHQNHINSYENEIDELLLFALMFTIHILLRLFTTKNEFRIFQECSMKISFVLFFLSKQPEPDCVNYS